MSKRSTSGKAEIERSLAETEFRDYEVKPLGNECYEITGRLRYICLLGKVGSQWGATHNMKPNEQTRLFDNPITALRYYVRNSAW